MPQLVNKKPAASAVPPGAVVSFSQAVTMNMGNYESSRVEVGIQLPVPSGSSAEETLRQAIQFVESNLKVQVDELDEARQQRPVKTKRR